MFLSPTAAERAAQDHLERLRLEAALWHQRPHPRLRTRFARLLQNVAVRLEPGLDPLRVIQPQAVRSQTLATLKEP